MQDNIYLDYAAATPLDPQVFEAMKPYFSERFYNPSADYMPAREAKDALEGARNDVARTLGVRPAEIIFTAGGTESTNLAICGVMDMNPGAEVLISAIEHEAVRKPAQRYNVREIPVNHKGIVDIAALEDMITDKTVLISVMLVNNEIGTIEPIKNVTALAEQIRKQRRLQGIQTPLFVHTDACQAALCLDLHLSRLGVDLMTLNGSKMYGPKYSGVLYAKAGVALRSQIVGGGQEWGMRSGTEHVAGAVGFAMALTIAQSRRHEYVKAVSNMRDELLRELQKNLGKDYVRVNGSLKDRAPNNLHVTFPGIDNERLLIELDLMGVYAAAGSACSANSDEKPHVLEAIGLDEAQYRASIRFSLGRQTDSDQIRRAVQKITQAINKQR